MMTVQVRKRGAPVTPPPGAQAAHGHMLRSQKALLCRLRKLGVQMRTV
jgi:hypothetical protein